jgi:processive 1,2-diacylglycerol beta-glucosyltransferase
MSPRVLILSVSAGSGHKAAAAALEEEFNASGRCSEVRNLDALDFTSETYRTLFSDLYFRLVKVAPWLVGLQYQANDLPFREPQLLRLIDRINAEPLVKLIDQFDPDITVCTHFLPAKIMSFLIARKELHTRLSVVTTDYDFQGMWLSTMFNRYFVAIEETRAHMVGLGLPEDRITVSGIPVSAAFTQPFDPATVLAQYQLRSDLPILLISAGAAGGSYARDIVTQVMGLSVPFQAVVVCGNNTTLRDEISAIVAPKPERFRVLGYTSEMPNLMRVSSLFVGKPGGLSSSECMAAGLPMFIINPIPGQEERNSDHLLEGGAAVRGNYRTTIGYKIGALLEDTERLERMRAAALRLGRPDAARVIVEEALNDQSEPLEISEEAQKRIFAAAKYGTKELPGSSHTNPIVLYHDQAGVIISTVTEDQLDQLNAHLERESLNDDDYYLTIETVELLRERGVDPALLAPIEAIILEHGEATIKWTRRP